MNDNPYHVLELEADATVDDIRKAFRKLAALHHPDKEGGDDEKFREIKAAHDFLVDGKNREMFAECGIWNQNHAGDVIKAAMTVFRKFVEGDTGSPLSNSIGTFKKQQANFKAQIQELKGTINRTSKILASLTQKDGKPLPKDDPLHLMLAGIVDAQSRQVQVLQYNVRVAAEAEKFLVDGYSMPETEGHWAMHPSLTLQSFSRW